MATQLEPRTTTIPQSQIKDMGFHSGPAFGLLRAAAEFLSKSDIIPRQFQGNLSNCAVALNMAQRMGADPLMVMQNLYIVYGRPGWSSQFLIATLNTSGQFSKLRYEWTNEKDKHKDGYGCRAHATELATGEELYGPWVTVALAKSEGWYNRESKNGAVASKWPTLTELMCMYRSASFFVRTYCPEIAMGLRTAEEEEEIHGAVNVTGYGSVISREMGKPESAAEEDLTPAADHFGDAIVAANKASQAPEPSAPVQENPAETQRRVQAERAAEKKGKKGAAGESTYSDTEPDPFAPGGDLFKG